MLNLLIVNLTALFGGRTLGLRLLAGMALQHQLRFARLRKRLRALPPNRATDIELGNGKPTRC